VRRRGPEIITNVGARDATVDWRSLYEANAPDLLRFLRRFTRELHTAEDLLHDAFARAMGARHVPPSDEMRPWLYRIATNVAISQLRRSRPLPLLGFLTEPPVAPIGEAEQVRQALHSIPPEQALTLTLVLHEGFSRSEAARILGVSEEAVKSRMARGRINFIAAYQRLERGLSR
jgi:RNA polymerase sigma-70 factor (ECF subfamily)